MPPHIFCLSGSFGAMIPLVANTLHPSGFISPLLAIRLFPGGGLVPRNIISSTAADASSYHLGHSHQHRHRHRHHHSRSYNLLASRSACGSSVLMQISDLHCAQRGVSYTDDTSAPAHRYSRGHTLGAFSISIPITDFYNSDIRATATGTSRLVVDINPSAGEGWGLHRWDEREALYT